MPFLRWPNTPIGDDLQIWQNPLVRITVNLLDALYRKLRSQVTREKRSVKVFDLAPQSPKVNSKKVRALDADQK